MSNPITPPATLQMDNYGSNVRSEFEDAEIMFFSFSKPFSKDNGRSLLSAYGYFKVDIYDNTPSGDKHNIVFFYNKVTKKVFMSWGTLAWFYLVMPRNNSLIEDFLIRSDRPSKENDQNMISVYSKYSLLWEASTNNVTKREYINFNPNSENKLVAYTEEYEIQKSVLNFKNWKNYLSDSTYKAYSTSRVIRSSGIPSQILLHETAFKSSLNITSAQKDGNDYYIPHFCINNIDSLQKGNIIQFVDISEKTYHGERTNDRSLGIEFVNSPVEVYEQEDYIDNNGKKKTRNKKGTDGNNIPVLKLHEAKDGIYITTKLGLGFQKLFIPLEFSDDKKEGDNFFELKVPEDKLINKTALLTLKGASNKNLAVQVGKEIIIKYAKSDKFLHLASLVECMINSNLIDGIADLKNDDIYKYIIKESSKFFYVWQIGWSGNHYYFDLRKPAILTHLLIGTHGDGSLQGLFLYLKFVKQIKDNEIFQYIVNVLTSDKTVEEKKGLIRKSICEYNGNDFIDAKSPIDIHLANILEII